MRIARNVCSVGWWLAVLSAGLLVLFLPSVARGADAPAEKPLATEKIDHDCIVEVTDIYRGSDGLLEVNWRYRNPTSERVQLMSSGEACELMNKAYIIGAGQKEEISRRDGTVDVRWRYVNQGKEPIELVSSSQARELPKQAWVMDPDKRCATVWRPTIASNRSRANSPIRSSIRANRSTCG